MAHETLLILDFGSQYTQLIARRVRELGVFSEIRRGDAPVAEIGAVAPIGVVLSGGPASIYEDGAIRPDPGVFALGVPVLGLCYGQQAMAQLLGGQVEPAGSREYGAADLDADLACPLFAGTRATQRVWMSHGDRVTRLPAGFTAVGRTDNAPAAAMADEARRFYGIQFHPEVKHTELGRRILLNFVNICGARRDWTPAEIRRDSVARIREQVPEGRIIVALSGGVDSSVTALLCREAVGERTAPIFVDTGLLRLGEGDKVAGALRRVRPRRSTASTPRRGSSRRWPGSRTRRRSGAGSATSSSRCSRRRRSGSPTRGSSPRARSTRT